MRETNMSKRFVVGSLTYGFHQEKIKACVPNFHQIFIFSPNSRPSKTMKNIFYFI